MPRPLGEFKKRANEEIQVDTWQKGCLSALWDSTYIATQYSKSTFKRAQKLRGVKLDDSSMFS